MCGFAGFLGGGISRNELTARNVISEMTKALYHRGPDDKGFWNDVNNGIHLGHQRLSIIELSAAGRQPMISPSGRFTLVFNGEIYNHLELRNLLENYNFSSWSGNSDTETLVASFDVLGLEKTIKMSHGMFGMAVWDKQNKTLSLIRDRMGEKPVYFGWQGSGDNKTFLFASELKAIRRHPSFESKIRSSSVSSFIRQGYIEAPYSIYNDIYKLEPGSILEISQKKTTPNIRRYWNVTDYAAHKNRIEHGVSFENYRINFEQKLTNVIQKQMLADVPVGAFLSGGVDSSLVVALMQSLSSKKIKTFSIGFNDNSKNEAIYSKAIAKFIGTDHTELYISPSDALDVLPKIINSYDEPFADSSQIPAYLVSRLASKDVKVALTGDGADELFCGYNRYKVAMQLFKLQKFCPFGLIKISNWILHSKNNKAVKFLNYAGRSFGSNSLGDRAKKLTHFLMSSTFDELYFNFIAYDQSVDSVLISTYPNTPTLINRDKLEFSSLNGYQRMMAFDQITYLPDDILVKLDRAAMANSLETRAPYLDHSLVEFSWQLPEKFKINTGMKKLLLFETLKKYIPENLFNRPKMGFGVPMSNWLRGDLRYWAEDLLSETRLKNSEFLDSAKVREKWKQHLSGNSNWQHLIWNILILESWIEKEKNN
ncbi:AsnB Asparagine synthase (glutamine-hydrolyzing) [Candidatus Methylopumilus universalis]|uniref:asparagine synthase (glutamine-hydrolyzing) n=1 Tax=Candidatus Methylopumilus universalis TaxID=2588536 RepID=UPI003BEEFB21